MNLNYTDIGHRIRMLRKRRGMTQEQLAERTELSVIHISHIETANTKLSLPALVCIANALDVTADTLLCGSLPNASEPFRQEIARTMQDCSDFELRVIADTVRSLKDTLRRWQ